MKRVITGALAAIVALGVAASTLGLVGTMVDASYLATSNAEGVAHVAPAFCSLFLAGAAILAWHPMWVFRLLAALWAVGAASFARPGLAQLGIDLSLWVLAPFVAVLAALAAGLALAAAGSRIVRWALWAAALSPVFVLVVLLLPPIAGDWATYFVIIAAAWIAPRAAAQQRSFLHAQ